MTMIEHGDMNLDQRVTSLEVELARLRTIVNGFMGVTGNWQPAKLVMSSPVDPESFGAWGGDWFDASPYGKLYGSKGEYHTGADLNRPGYADSGANIYAAADGIIVYSGLVSVPGWQGDVVVLQHIDIQQPLWTRYAHIVSLVKTQVGAFVKRGTFIGKIADYTPKGPQGDHFHFDVSYLNLGDRPGDWPGNDLQRLLRTYLDPLQCLKDHQP